MAAFPPITCLSLGPSAPLVLNMLKGYSPYFSPTPAWALGLIATVSNGASLTYNVEITGDQQPNNTTGSWNIHDTMAGLTASANGNVAFPITGIRLNVTAYSNGSVNLGTVQWP
jgi:hypothetical protein